MTVGRSARAGAGPSSLAGWTPIALSWDGEHPVVRWCFTDGVQFTDPFFDQSIDRCLEDPFRLLFWRETDIRALAELSPTSAEDEPAGFIFHMSRCGSTLLTQMLATLPTTLALSEPGPLEAVLRARTGPPRLSDTDVRDLFRWMVAALGRTSRAEQTHYVVKLQASAILHLPLIRMAFPRTRCVFVYRDPVEVIVSQLADRGYDLYPGALPPDLLGRPVSELLPSSDEDYCAMVLASFCDSAIRAARDGHVTLIQYSTLPEAVPDIIAPLFGIELDAAQRAVLASVAGRHAKHPAHPFVGDAADKRRQATPEVHSAVTTWISRGYESLEALRLEQLRRNS